MQPSHGQGGRNTRRNEESLEQRLQRTNLGLQQQGNVPYPGLPGPAYALPYAFPGYPQQGQPRPFGQTQQVAAGPTAPGAQLAPYGSQRPTGSRPFPPVGPGVALLPQLGAIRAPVPQPYAAYYPQFQPAYGYLAPGAPWRPILGHPVATGYPQQAQPIQAPFGYQPQPRPPPPQGGRQGGRQGRGRGGRQPNPGRGQGVVPQGGQQYRDAWQEVMQVSLCHHLQLQ